MIDKTPADMFVGDERTALRDFRRAQEDARDFHRAVCEDDLFGRDMVSSTGRCGGQDGGRTAVGREFYVFGFQVRDDVKVWQAGEVACEELREIGGLQPDVHRRFE